MLGVAGLRSPYRAFRLPLKSPSLALGVARLRSPYRAFRLPLKSPRLALGVARLRSPYSTLTYPRTLSPALPQDNQHPRDSTLGCFAGSAVGAHVDGSAVRGRFIALAVCRITGIDAGAEIRVRRPASGAAIRRRIPPSARALQVPV